MHEQHLIVPTVLDDTKALGESGCSTRNLDTENNVPCSLADRRDNVPPPEGSHHFTVNAVGVIK